MLFPSLLSLGGVGLFVLRLVVGIVFIYHGWAKLKNSKAMAQAMGMPSAMPLILGFVEVFSGLGLIFGILIQLAAILLGLVMVGATFMKITKWGMPFGVAEKPGWALDLIILSALLVILFTGGVL